MISAENQISSEEVTRSYQNQRFQKVSLNNLLDIFYDDCISNHFSNNLVYFFHTQMLTPAEHLSFAVKFNENENRRFNKRLYRWKTKLDERLEKLQKANSHGSMSLCPGHISSIHGIEEDNKRNLLLDILEYSLWHGIHATMTFDLRPGKPNGYMRNESVKLIKSKLAASKPPRSSEWENQMRQSIFKDLELRMKSKMDS